MDFDRLPQGQKVPCKRADLISFIQAYSVAGKTENQILMGLSGDALNKMLDTLTFREDLDEIKKVMSKEEPKEPTPRRRTVKAKNDDDF